MQGDVLDRDPARRQRGQQVRGEVQARRRRGHRAVGPGIDGLVVAAIPVVLRPLGGDIGRQGHLAPLIDGGVQVGTGEVEGQDDLAPLPLLHDRGVQGAQQAGAVRGLAEAHPVTGGQLLARPHERRPAAGRQPPVQGRLHRDVGGVADPPALQPRRDHPGVVDHQHVTRAEFARQVGHRQVGQHAAGAHAQQPGRVAGRCGAEGDAVLGQVEVEIGKLHGGR